MDRGAKSAGQRAHRAALRDPAGPPGEGNASGGNRWDRSGESFFRNPFSSGVGAAFYGGATSSPRCTSTARARTATGRNPKRARRAPGGRRSHRELGWKSLGGCPGKKSARGFVERRWRSNGDWMARTGCVSAGAICTCAPARTRCDRQVLPAYGVQALPIKKQSPPTESNLNTMCLPITLGENHGSGHFYLAQTRTFLLCVDIADIGGGHGHLLRAVLMAMPTAKGILFDQPIVIREAAALGSDRLTLQGGDFFKESLPVADA